MVNCPSCGANVTGKKFCQQCGTPVRPATPVAASGATCPRCNGAVNAGASFCMHCGAALNVQTQIPPPPPATSPCPSCYAEIAASSAFCTNCGHNMNVAAGALACTNCGRQNNPGTKFCGGCGAQLGQTRLGAMPQTNYGQQPSGQYSQQYQQPQPQYGQPQYPQGNYQVQPMMGQQPMVLRCPTCMALAPLGAPFCQRCRTNLAGVVPVPAQQAGQQGGVGGFLQSDGGKLAAGALGGAAAVIGGQMLFNGLENAIEQRVEGDMGFGGDHHHNHHRQEDNGILGNLGKLADDIGLI